jgi:hypothetical protein
MPRPACKIDAQRRKGFNSKPDVRLKPDDRGDADVDAPCQYVLYHLIRVGNGEPDPQAWMCANDTGDSLGDGDLARKWAGTDRNRSRFEPGEELNLPPQIGVASEYPYAAFEQNAAKRRRYRALARPIEQGNPEGPLQRRNPTGETRLRSTDLLGRPREVAVAPERDREADESEIIHDTDSVSRGLRCDIGHIEAAKRHCAPLPTPPRPTPSAWANVRSARP